MTCRNDTCPDIALRTDRHRKRHSVQRRQPDGNHELARHRTNVAVKLNQEIATTLRKPETQERLAKLGLDMWARRKSGSSIAATHRTEVGEAVEESARLPSSAAWCRFLVPDGSRMKSHNDLERYNSSDISLRYTRYCIATDEMICFLGQK